MLGVDRQDLGAGGLSKLHHELSPHDQRLLVGQREVDALAERGDGRQEPRGPDDRVQDHVALAARDQLDDPLRPRQDLAVGPRLAGPGGGIRVGEGDSGDAVALEPARAAAPRPPTHSGRRPASSPCERETTSRAWTPIDPVEPRMATRRGTAWIVSRAGWQSVRTRAPGGRSPARTPGLSRAQQSAMSPA